jgi:protein-S-isoprenylcysteine O-methyltransferase Ste14
MTTTPDIQPKPSFLVRYRTRISLALGLLLLPVVLFCRFSYAFNPKLPAVQFALDGIATVLIVLGMLTRLWSTLYIGGRKNEELQQTGPYSLVRNPLYVGSFLISMGLTIMSGNPVALVITLVYFTIQYRTTIRHEERVLTEIFGDAFREYMARVPSFLPKLSGFDPTPPDTIVLTALSTELRNSLVYLAAILLWQGVTTLQVAGIWPVWLFP